jgi:predicted RNA-binding protein YlxR (DUF448 family)
MTGHSKTLADAAGDEHRRRCIASGAVKDKGVLLRFVIDPLGQVVPDVDERLPGRGIWVSANRQMLKKACEKNLFARAARAQVTVPADLVDRVEGLLVRRCLDTIGLARRAGQAVSGYERVSEWLRAGRGGVLLAAADGAPAACAKMRAAGPDVPVVELFSGDELGMTAGRERTVHLVIAPGKLAQGIRREAARLSGFRGGRAQRAHTGKL